MCVFGPSLVYFVAGATCWSGQTSPTPSLLSHVVGFCMHARAHTGLQSHVTFSRGKRVEECYTSDSACASETSALVSPDTPRCGITGKPNHDTVPPAHALVYHLVLPCATVVVHARCVRHSFTQPSALPLFTSSAAATRLSKPKTPRSLGEILADRGLSKHSALWSRC